MRKDEGESRSLEAREGRAQQAGSAPGVTLKKGDEEGSERVILAKRNEQSLLAR